MKIKFSDNSFDYIRIVGTMIVMLSHSFRWFEVDKPSQLMFFTDGSIGVMMFFGMTGYLVVGGYERGVLTGRKNKDFWRNRILRLYPALVISFLLITAIDVFFLKLNIFSLEFVKHSILYLFFGSGNSYMGKGISNGVLWTIPVDIIFYLITPLVYKYGRNMSIKKWIIVIVFMWQFNLWDKYIISALGQIPIVGKYIGIAFPLCFMYEFLIGSFLYFYRDTIVRILSKKKPLVVMVSLFCVWYCVYNYTGWIPYFGEMHNPIFGLIVPALTIFLAYGLGKHNLSNDISYGVFLYHMVVVGVLLNIGVRGWKGIVTTVIISLVVGYLSCKFVEQPILKRKSNSFKVRKVKKEN